MILLVALFVGTLVTALIRREAGVRDWARCGLGTALVLAGGVHLVQPLPFEQHIPDWVPATPALVFVSGVTEILLGIALVGWQGRRQPVGMLVAVYLVAVFPANAYVAVAGVEVDGQPGGPYPWIRLPFQALFIAWALWCTRSDGDVEPNDIDRSRIYPQTRHLHGITHTNAGSTARQDPPSRQPFANMDARHYR